MDRPPVAVAVAPAVRPSDPAVPAGKRLRHRLEPDAAQPAPLPIGHEGADLRPERALVAEVGVPVDEGVPQLPPLGVGDRLDAKQAQFRPRSHDLRLRVGGRGPDRGSGPVADGVLAHGRQRQDAVALQGLQHPEAGPDPGAALRCRPVKGLAEGLRPLVAAAVGTPTHGLPNLRDRLAGPAAARTGGRLQVDDSRVHGDSRSHDSTTSCESAGAGQAVRGRPVHAPKRHLLSKACRYGKTAVTSTHRSECHGPVEGCLLTGLPADHAKAAREIGGWYALRRRIEGGFRGLKSGFRVERLVTR